MLIVVQLQAHSIVNFVVFQGDVILSIQWMCVSKRNSRIMTKRTYLKYCVPFLDTNFLWSGSYLRGDEQFEIPNCVVFIAFHANFLAQSVVAHHFDHSFAVGFS